MVYNRRYQRKVPTNKQLDKKIRKLENEDELKFKDTLFLVSQTDAAAGTVYPIGLVGQGIDARARIGDFIRPTSLKCRFTITFQPNTVINSTSVVRMIIFYDSEPAGELPIVVDSTSVDSESLLDIQTSAFPILMQYNYSTMQSKYKVLVDKVMTLNSQAGSGLTASVIAPTPITKYWKKSVKLSRKTIYSGDGALITALQSNGLFICFLYETFGGAIEDPNTLDIVGNIRMYYKDA